MKRIAELGKMLVGYVLEAPEPKRALLAAGVHPEELGDKFLGSCWTVMGQIAQEGQRVNAAELFAAGVTRKMLSADDLALLQALQARNTLDEKAFFRVAEEVRKHARADLIGRELRELGDELLDGKSTPDAVYPRFRAVVENYNQLHAAGRRGSEVVVAAVEEFERRKRDGRPGMVTTGISAIDEVTGGFPLKLVVMLGPPATFKSGLMGSMLRRQLAAGLRPLVVSLEDRDTWLVKRYAAADLGMKVRDVFNAPFPDEAKAADAFNAMANEMHEAWFLTKRHARSAEEILQLATRYRAQHNINLVYVDNARAVKARVDPKAKWREDRRAEQSRMYELFAEWADMHQVPLVLLVHTTRDYIKRTGGKKPPELQDIGETSDGEKDVRMLLSLWQKHGRLRLTLAKQTEGNVRDAPTLEFSMLGESALVDPDSAEQISLPREEREERERSDDAKWEQEKRRRLRSEKWNDERKAEKAAPKLEPVAPADQAELGLDVAPATKPTPLVVLDGGKAEKPEETP